MSQQKKVLIYGAGKIGRGFIGHIMQRSGIAVYFVDAVPALVDALNAAQSYTVHIAGCPEKNERIHCVRAFLADDAALGPLYEDVDLIVSCVGARYICDTARSIAGRLQARQSRENFNWIICENAYEPASMIREVLNESDDPAWQEYVKNSIGLIETQVLRSGMDVDAETAAREPLAVKMQDWWTLPADADALRGSLPEIDGLQLRHNFSNELKRKLYTFNGLNGPIAYVGALRGIEYMHLAAGDSSLQKFYDDIQEESAHGLCAEFSFDAAEHAEFQALARKKYQDPHLQDAIDRNAQDSARKLGGNERLWGPALLCYKHGRIPSAYIRAIACALAYRGASDDVGTALVQDTIAAIGVAACVQEIAGLPLADELVKLVVEEYARIETERTLKCT